MKYPIIGYIVCGAGALMLITGLLPERAIYALLGNEAMPRGAYLLSGTVLLGFGLWMLGVLHP